MVFEALVAKFRSIASPIHRWDCMPGRGDRARRTLTMHGLSALLGTARIEHAAFAGSLIPPCAHLCQHAPPHHTQPATTHAMQSGTSTCAIYKGWHHVSFTPCCLTSPKRCCPTFTR